MSRRGKTAPGPRWLPGDPAGRAKIERMIRVDHAGEYGATRIYAGQLAVLGPDHPAAPAIRDMAEQEQRHLEAFEEMITDRRVRPTALVPLWHVTGFALGAATAMLGAHAAMACTVAVEETIEEHYAGQAGALEGEAGETGLKSIIEEFRDDELAHRDTALAHGAEQAPAWPVLTAAIKTGSRLAIWLSERI